MLTDFYLKFKEIVEISCPLLKVDFNQSIAK